MSLEECKQIQREHVASMADSLNSPESYARMLEINRRRYGTYLLDLFFQRPGRILDIGCGYAEVWFRLLRERGFTYYGVDLNEGVVAYLAELLSGQGDEEYAKRGMLEKIPHPDQFFDVVYTSHVLEHTTDIAQALAEVRRVMKDNGYLIFAVPTDFADDGPAHIHRRDKSGWIEDLTANGFVIEKSGQFDFNRNEFYGRAVKRGYPSRKEREQDARSPSSRSCSLRDEGLTPSRHQPRGGWGNGSLAHGLDAHCITWSAASDAEAMSTHCESVTGALVTRLSLSVKTGG